MLVSEASTIATNKVNASIIKYLMEYNLKSIEKLRVEVVFGMVAFSKRCE